MSELNIPEISAEALGSIDIRELLPQREPMIMVDRVEYFTPQLCTTVFEIKPDNIFLKDNKFTIPGMVENIAQTCAARLGVVYHVIRNAEVPIGYIGAVKNFKATRQPAVGETLRTTVETVMEVFGMTLVKGEIKIGDEIVATAELKIALAQNSEK